MADITSKKMQKIESGQDDKPPQIVNVAFGKKNLLLHTYKLIHIMF